MTRYRRTIALITLTLALTAAAITGPTPPPANAHSYDGYATIYCSAHPIDGQSLIHAWPYSLGPGVLYYVCTWDFFGVRHQVFVGRNMSTGAHWQQGTPQKCAPHGYTICEPHG